MNDDDPKLDQLLCFSIYSAGHALNRIYKPLLTKLDLTYPQYLVMILLWERDGRTVGQIAAKLSLESSTVTPLVKRLEAAGHLMRMRDVMDERQVRVMLTLRGSALRYEAGDVPGCIIRASGQTAASLERLKAEIDTLRVALDRAASGDTADHKVAAGA